jgi:hypothetical protein
MLCVLTPSERMLPEHADEQQGEQGGRDGEGNGCRGRRITLWPFSIAQGPSQHTD